MPAVPKLLQQVLTCLGLGRTGARGWQGAGRAVCPPWLPPRTQRQQGWGAWGSVCWWVVLESPEENVPLI